MKERDAAILAAGLGGWTVVAVGTETVVLAVPCSNKWVAMVHCIVKTDDVDIIINFGHPKWVREGETITVPFSDTLATDLWAKIRANASGIAMPCAPTIYEVLYGETFITLLRLAAVFAFWPRKPTLCRSKNGVWRVSDGRTTVFVSCFRGDVHVNAVNVGAYSTRQWLGTESQDFIFFALCCALKHERSAGHRGAPAQAAGEDG